MRLSRKLGVPGSRHAAPGRSCDAQHDRAALKLNCVLVPPAAIHHARLSQSRAEWLRNHAECGSRGSTDRIYNNARPLYGRQYKLGTNPYTGSTGPAVAADSARF